MTILLTDCVVILVLLVVTMTILLTDCVVILVLPVVTMTILLTDLKPVLSTGRLRLARTFRSIYSCCVLVSFLVVSYFTGDAIDSFDVRSMSAR